MFTDKEQMYTQTFSYDCTYVVKSLFLTEPHAHDKPYTKVRHLKELALPIITKPLLQPGVPGCTGRSESLGVRSTGSSTGLCVVKRCNACGIMCGSTWQNACPSWCIVWSARATAATEAVTWAIGLQLAAPRGHFIVFAWQCEALFHLCKNWAETWFLRRDFWDVKRDLRRALGHELRRYDVWTTQFEKSS